MSQHIFEQLLSFGTGQIFQSQEAAVGFPLTPDHLFKVLICGDDNALFTSGPAQNLFIPHLGIAVGHLNYIVTSLHQPSCYSPAGVDVYQKFHAGTRSKMLSLVNRR